MRTPKWLNGRSGLVALALLALSFAAVTFGQSSGSNHGQALGLGKLEAALEVLNGSNIDPNATAGVIVQFLEDEEIAGGTGTKADIKLAAKLARQQAIADAGGTSEREFDNLPFHAARVTFGALKRLEGHPYVKRISLDHPVQGSLDRTVKAVGADLAWAGGPGRAGVWGDGVLWGDSINISGNTILAGHGSTGAVRGITSAKWYPTFLAPASVTASTEPILIQGEVGAVPGLRTGPQGAWFYPPSN